VSARALRGVHRPGMQDRKLGDAAVPFGGKAGHARDLHASGDLTFEITDSLHKSIDHMAMQVRAHLILSLTRSSRAVGCPSHHRFLEPSLQLFRPRMVPGYGLRRATYTVFHMQQRSARRTRQRRVPANRVFSAQF
jgi:hypothetical protein